VRDYVCGRSSFNEGLRQAVNDSGQRIRCEHPLPIVVAPLAAVERRCRSGADPTARRGDRASKIRGTQTRGNAMRKCSEVRTSFVTPPPAYRPSVVPDGWNAESAAEQDGDWGRLREGLCRRRRKWIAAGMRWVSGWVGPPATASGW
jgi:hypothetical protein